MRRLMSLVSAGMLIGGLLAGCTSGRSTSAAGSGCQAAAFTLPSEILKDAQGRPLGGSTPELAVQNFLAHGSVHGSIPPLTSPSSVGIPANGWATTKSDGEGVTFSSGNNTLHASELSGHVWVIDSGQVCS
jgi:hypothetical protein